MKILVPFDFSIGSRSAVKFAVHLAHQLPGAELDFLHAGTLVHTPRYVLSGMKIPSLAEQREKLLAEMRNFVMRSQSQADKIHHAGRDVVQRYHLLDTANSAGAILDTARVINADLIVMGTTGESNIRRIVMGSTTMKVIESAPCPVLTVPLKHKLRAMKMIAVASELVNTDKELYLVHKLLEGLNAHYKVIHVYPVFPQKVLPSPEVVSRLSSKIEKFLSEDRYSFSLVKTSKDNELIIGLEKELSRLKPALLVMFHRQRTWLDKLISRSETATVAFHTKIPVLSVRTDLIKPR
jgi:nucleotide-binding universal stress UspA family protein